MSRLIVALFIAVLSGRAALARDPAAMQDGLYVVAVQPQPGATADDALFGGGGGADGALAHPEPPVPAHVSPR